ncbi:MAG: hypothetical protein EOP60_06665 [Sphingomonadales bacterium]|nr:MAG: hypothetical protein EOP60_06665 [Sphingomonadales bacterium]
MTMGGFFAQADVQGFVRELRTRLADLSTAPNAHLMLCDVRQMRIQTQEIVSAFAGVVGNAEFRSRRLAFVTGSSLSRLQARRLTSREGVQFFDNVEEAEGWLFENPDSGAARELHGAGQGLQG